MPSAIALDVLMASFHTNFTYIVLKGYIEEYSDMLLCF